MKITFGDNVKILAAPDTEKVGISNKTGQVYGETVPSSTNVEVIGSLKEDYAINVFIEELSKDYWLAPHLVELIDHAAGTEIIIGNHKSVRQADGSWKEVDIEA